MSLFHSLLSSGYDNEYQLILDRARILGYTLPSEAQRTKQNQLVINLKAAGIWSLLDILYIFATDGGTDFATINWKAPSSFQITKVNTPTFTNNEGFNFNGTTQYLNTNWRPGTDGINYTQNSASVGVYVNEAVTANSLLDFGCSNNADGITQGIFLNSRNDSNNATNRTNDNTTFTASVSTSLGFNMNQRRASNDKREWKDGSQVGSTQTTTSTTPPTVNLFFGASNGNGTAVTPSTRELGCAFAGSSLSGLENTFYTHWNTYFTSL